MTIFINTKDPDYVDGLKRHITDSHIVDISNKPISRYMHLKNAYRGSIFIGDDELDKNSPMFVGTTLKTFDEVKSSLEWSKNRAKFFSDRFPAEIMTRVYADPTNIIVGDPEGVDPRDFINIFPDNWWGSCAYLTSYDPKKLFTILEMYLYYTKPVAVTDKAADTLSRIGLDFVDAREYTLDKKGGLLFREYTRRSESFDFLLEEKPIES